MNDQPLLRSAFPEITYRHGLSIHFNEDELRVVHFPQAHTDGDGVVFFTKSNVVHMGDVFFNGRFPYIDLDSGGTVAGYTAAVRAGIEAGSSLEQIQASGLPDEWSSWGQGWIDSDRWLSIVYERLR